MRSVTLTWLPNLVLLTQTGSAYDTDVLYLPCDLADAEACEALVASTDRIVQGQLHGLVCSAGVAFPRATLDETTPEAFDRMMNIK